MSNELIALAIIAVTIAQLLAVAVLVLRLTGFVGVSLSSEEKQSLAVKVVGLILGVIFTELLAFNFIPMDVFPNASPFVLYALCGIAVGSGGDTALGLVKLWGSGVQLVRAQTAKTLTASDTRSIQAAKAA